MPQWVPPRGPEHWLTRSGMTRQTWGYEPGKVFLGTLPDDESALVARGDDRHIVTIAGSRTGKSSTSLLPNLKSWPGSVLVIDPKGELARIAADWRASFGRVVILDPFNVTGQRDLHGWNPFDELEHLPPDLIPDEAAAVAEALIIDDGRDSHWPQAARNLVRALVLYMLAVGEGTANLSYLRKYLTSGGALIDVLDTMAGSDAFEGIVANLGASLRDTNERERSSIISAAVTQTAFLDSPGLSRVSRHSTFGLSDLAGDRPISVFLVLPSGRIPTHHRWLRLFISMAMTAMEQAPRPPKLPVLWMLEEFAQLGHMRALQSAAGYMAGYGVKLWLVLQDLPQLQAHYQDGWETFLGNAGLVQAFGNSDPTTLAYLSRRLGQIEVDQPAQGHVDSSSMRRGDFGERGRKELRDLLSPTEIEQLFARETQQALIIAAGQKPLVTNRRRWDQV